MLRSTAVHLRQVMVLGSGTMGGGIAQVTAVAGHKVRLVDQKEELLSKSLNGIEKSLTRTAAKKYKDQPEAGKDYVAKAMGCIEVTTDSDAAASSSDLIIEAIVEDMEIKKKVWAGLDKVAPKDTIFASNTSSLKIGTMADATQRPQLFGGLHFFSPVPMMRLVEVVKAEQTSTETADALFQFSKEIGKTPIRCKDTKGFVVNRLLIPLFLEAIRMAERGDASVEDIDIAMKLGAGHPMGPLELSDAVGNDVVNFIVQGWHKADPEDPLFKPPPMLEGLIREGKLGNKVGKGFYTKDA